LKDVDVEADLADGEDPVQVELERAFDNFADKRFEARELPESLNTENVAKRVEFLLESDHANPLPVAVEIVSFHRMDLLPEDQTSAALEKLFDSPSAGDLISASKLDRLEVIKKWLPELEEDG
jgi:hypothetical protein